MNGRTLHVALVRDVFFDAGGRERLAARLGHAREQGAQLAILPELPMDRWAPATRDVRDDDAEPPGGPRHAALAHAARTAGLGLVGGAIVTDPSSGQRFNTALVFDAAGALVASYRKIHLPQELGFFERDHYAASDDPPARVDGFELPFGVQICSDANRPVGTHLLAAQGCTLVAVPRATEASTWADWQLVLRANARTACCFVGCVPRPRAESGVPLGGPSFVAGPRGEVLVETEDDIATFAVAETEVIAARAGYPGYLRTPVPIYAAGWTRLLEE